MVDRAITVDGVGRRYCRPRRPRLRRSRHCGVRRTMSAEA